MTRGLVENYAPVLPQPIKIIVGAGRTSQAGWTALQRSDLDIRDRRSWRQRYLPNSLDAGLAEHVMEHLDKSEAVQAARNVFEFLKPGGYWRIAVPDANNPNPHYREWNRPNGQAQRWFKTFVYAADEPDHKVFYNLDSLTALLRSVGFAVRPLEYYDAQGRFHRYDWKQSDGIIHRSFGHDYLKINALFTGVYNTSLIVDAIKFIK